MKVIEAFEKVLKRELSVLQPCKISFANGMISKKYDSINQLFFEGINDISCLNWKIEIIEEDKEIEELHISKSMKKHYGIDYSLTHQEFFIQEKINELIKEVNKLKKEGK